MSTYRVAVFIACLLFAGIALASDRTPAEIFSALETGGAQAGEATEEFRSLVYHGDYPGNEEQLSELLEFCRRHVARFLRGEIPSSEYRWLPTDVAIALYQLRRFPMDDAAPLARDILQVAKNPVRDRSMRGARNNALSILANLKDASVREPLERMAAQNDDGILACRLLVDLGDARSISALEAVKADTTLADSLIARDRRLRDDPAHVNVTYLEREAAKVRVAAGRAARDLQLYQRGIVIPFDLSDHHVERLLDQGFTVLPETAKDLYDFLKPEYPFVTSDVIWRTFMILMRGTWDDLEPLVIAPDMRGWLSALLQASVDQAAAIDDPELQRLAWINAARVQVATMLFDDDASAPMPERELRLAAEEVGRIVSAEGLHFSELLGYEEDYPSYRPNGRHTASPDQERWFRAMRWLGRATWRFADDDGIQQTLLLADLVRSKPGLLDRWRHLDSLMSRWIGASDDITLEQVLAAVPDPRRVLENDDEFGAATAALRALPLPSINSLPDAENPEHGQGMRLLGSRYSATAEAVQRQLDDDIWPPSTVAALSNLLERFDTVDPSKEPLPAAGMACLAGLDHTDPRVPPFMTTDAWEHKQLNTSLAGWAELQHALAPYLKTAVDYKGLSSPSDRFHGYVEPSVVFYERLLELVRRSIADLERCGFFERLAADIPAQSVSDWQKEHHEQLMSGGIENITTYYREQEAFRVRRMRPDRSRWRDFEALLLQLIDLSRRELAGDAQTVADCVLMRNLNHRLQNLSLTDNNLPKASEPMGFATEIALNRNQENEALLLAVGRPLAALVAVSDGAGRVYVCKGPVYSFHEIVTGADERFTDDQWREADTFPGPGSRVPWIFSHPDLDWQRDITAEELRDLTLSRDRSSSFSLNVREVARWRRRHQELADVRVPPELADLLCEVVTHPDVRRSDRMHLLENAARMTGSAITVDDWNTFLDVAEHELDEDQQRYTWSRCAMIIYWSLRGLPQCPDGSEGIARANRLLARLSDHQQEGIAELLALPW